MFKFAYEWCKRGSKSQDTSAPLKQLCLNKRPRSEKICSPGSATSKVQTREEDLSFERCCPQVSFGKTIFRYPGFVVNAGCEQSHNGTPKLRFAKVTTIAVLTDVQLSPLYLTECSHSDPLPTYMSRTIFRTLRMHVEASNCQRLTQDWHARR